MRVAIRHLYSRRQVGISARRQVGISARRTIRCPTKKSPAIVSLRHDRRALEVSLIQGLGLLLAEQPLQGQIVVGIDFFGGLASSL